MSLNMSQSPPQPPPLPPLPLLAPLPLLPPNRQNQQKKDIPFGKNAIYSANNPYGWTELFNGFNNISFLYDIENNKKYYWDKLQTLNKYKIIQIRKQNLSLQPLKIKEWERQNKVGGRMTQKNKIKRKSSKNKKRKTKRAVTSKTILPFWARQKKFLTKRKTLKKY